jgi:hypothetical protein
MLAFGITVSIYEIVFPVQSVGASPDECPQGAKSGCDWVQHRVTLKCKWLPSNAVADPWESVPEGSCPAKVVNTLVPANTKTPVPYYITNTSAPAIIETQVQEATNTPVGNIVHVATCTPTPVIKQEIVITLTPGTCNLCKIEQQKADAMSTSVALQATFQAWQMRP